MNRVGRRAVLLGAESALLALAGCEASAPSEPSTPSPSGGPRSVSRVVSAMPTRDGAGVRLSRSIGSSALSLLDPFLLLDEIRSDVAGEYIKGFPDHPHRGFETVTYMIEGAMEHRDIIGNHGRLVSGSAQWMTAGRGIIHSEMPQQESGLLWGFQLWVNLPARLKLTAPKYRDIAPSGIPEISLAGSRVRVVAGAVGAVRGPIDDVAVAPTMLDITLTGGATVEQELVSTHNAFAYVIEGAAELGPEKTRVERGQLAVLGVGNTALASSSGGARLLLLAGEPIGEPVARRGPFVMNTEEELNRAVLDYQSGRLLDGG